MSDDYIKLVEPEITGGKISIGRIDTLSDIEGDRLRISGLRQGTLEHLVNKFGYRFKRIEFWKCGNVEDLQPLEDLRITEDLFWFLNKKSTSLWDLSKNNKLTSLHLKSFNKIKEINEFARSDTLKRIIIEDGMWGKGEVESLSPLSIMPALEILEISSNVQDKKLEPITKIKTLKEFYYPANRFSTEHYAWLAARLGDRVISNVTQPTRHIDNSSITNSKGDVLDTLITGKRKPFLNSNKHKVRLDKYTAEWVRLVDCYAENPNLGEPV